MVLTNLLQISILLMKCSTIKGHPSKSFEAEVVLNFVATHAELTAKSKIDTVSVSMKSRFSRML